MNRKGKPVTLKRFVTFDGEGKATDGSGLRFDDWRNWLLVQSWLKDHRADIMHVFVSRPLRRRLLRYAAAHPAFKKHHLEAASFLREPSDSSAHDDHFHVRIGCPKRQADICIAHPKQ